MAQSPNYSTSNQYVIYCIEQILNSQSIANNTSNVTIKVWFQRTNSGYETYGSGTCYCTINGTQYSAAVGPSQRITSSWICLFSKTLDIPHNSDGTKGLYCSASISIDAPLSSSTQGMTFTLPTIPRSSLINSMPNFTIAGAANVTLAPVTTSYSSSFNLDFSLYIGSTWIASWNDIAANGGSQTHSLTLTAAQQDTIMANMKTVTSGTMLLYCTTQSGSTQIGSTVSIGVICSIDASVKPTLSTITAAEQTTAVTTLAVGSYVKGISTIKYTATATVMKSATIASYKIKYKGVDISLGTANTYTTPAIDWTSQTVTMTVTDSRGRTASKDLALTALNYIAPTFQSFTTQRSDLNGLIKDDGTYVKISATGTITSLNSKNQWTYALYARVKGTASWGTAIATGTGTVGTTAFTYNANLSTYSILNSYEFRLDLTDKFNTTLTINLIPTGGVIMTMDDVGVGIAKVRTKGALDVGGEIWTDGAIVHPFGTTRIYEYPAAYDGYSGNITGTCKITLPKGWTNTMMSLVIRGYNYNSVGAWTLKVGGYNYSTTPAWVNTSAILDDPAPFTQVRFASEGSKCCILLGTTTTVWNYPRLFVEQMNASYSNTEGWGSGWSIDFVTTETGIVNITTKNVSAPLPVGGGAMTGDINLQGNQLTFNDVTGYLLTPNGASNYGLHWDTDLNEFQWRGGGANKWVVDLDDGHTWQSGAASIAANDALLKLYGTSNTFIEFYRTTGARTAWMGHGNGNNEFQITNQESGPIILVANSIIHKPNSTRPESYGYIGNYGAGTYGVNTEFGMVPNSTGWGSIGTDDYYWRKMVCTSLVQKSSMETKYDIVPFDAVQAYEDIKNIKLYAYRHRSSIGPSLDGKTRDEHLRLDLQFGIMADSGPIGVVPYDSEGSNGTGIDLYSWSTYIASALKVSIEKIDKLETKVDTLEMNQQNMMELIQTMQNEINLLKGVV